jgi:hypothetical protein
MPEEGGKIHGRLAEDGLRQGSPRKKAPAIFIAGAFHSTATRLTQVFDAW